MSEKMQIGLTISTKRDYEASIIAQPNASDFYTPVIDRKKIPRFVPIPFLYFLFVFSIKML